MDHTTNILNVLMSHLDTKIGFGTANSNSKSTEKTGSEYSMERLHPYSSDNILATNPNFELRDGFVIPLNQFWNTLTTPRTS